MGGREEGEMRFPFSCCPLYMTTSTAHTTASPALAPTPPSAHGDWGRWLARDCAILSRTHRRDMARGHGRGDQWPDARTAAEHRGVPQDGPTHGPRALVTQAQGAYGGSVPIISLRTPTRRARPQPSLASDRRGHPAPLSLSTPPPAAYALRVCACGMSETLSYC
ncbi:hypothetical protein AcV5_007462 [Taiwanofungus camphoratus]|nr:hypothetical protein AcV5_007462 [Antrodia cinnamomea]